VSTEIQRIGQSFTDEAGVAQDLRLSRNKCGTMFEQQRRVAF